MERSNKFFGLSKTLAAGALALAMVPGSVLATATYDGGAFFQFTNVSASDNVELIFSADDCAWCPTNTSLSGSGSVFAEAFPPVVGETDLDGITPSDVRVTGSADPTPGVSVSSADAHSVVSITAINLSPTGGTEDVVFDFIYGADVSASLTDALLESAFADVSIFMDVAFGNQGAPIVNELLSAQDNEGDPDPLFGQGSFTLTLQPDGINGVQVFLDAVGQATSVSDDTQVPVPASLALLGIGLIGFALRKRLGSARS